MAIDYVALAATARRLLVENGKTGVLLRSKFISGSDPVAGTVTSPSNIDVAVNAVQTEYNEDLTPDAEIEQDDEFYALDTAAKTSMKLVVDGEERQIVQAWIKKPGDVFLVCFVQTRR